MLLTPRSLFFNKNFSPTQLKASITVDTGCPGHLIAAFSCVGNKNFKNDSRVRTEQRKKMLYIFFLLLFSASRLFSAPCGDVDTSGAINIVDALIIAQYYVGLNPPNFDSTAADINADNLINILDALFVAQYYVGLISALPGCSIQTPSPTSEPVSRGILHPDRSEEFLTGNPKGCTIADKAPVIEFGLLRIDSNKYGNEYGHWGNVVSGPDGNYYLGLGNHQQLGGALLVSFNYETGLDEIRLYSQDILGHKEGKWHGRPEINPATGDMFLIGFYIGDLVKYNINTRTFRVLGQPDPGYGFPEHIWDWERGLLYGLGDLNDRVLVYDTKNEKVIHAGVPVNSSTGKQMGWFERSRLLDKKTGNLYGSAFVNPSGSTLERPTNLTVYNPVENTFSLLNLQLDGALRAWTSRRDKDGAYWIFDNTGRVYRFFPDTAQLIKKGVTWGSNGWYVTFIVMSPDEKYLYYSLGRPSAADEGLPVIQYNTETGEKTVIAFLTDFYLKNYNYTAESIYGGALNAEGNKLFLTANGRVKNGSLNQSVFIIDLSHLLIYPK